MPGDLVPRGSGRQDPVAMIASQIIALTDDQASVTLQRERAWASITFVGTRYCFAIEWGDDTRPVGLKNLAQILPDYEFTIPGYFVADILVTEQSGLRWLIEVLLIVDPVEVTRDS